MSPLWSLAALEKQNKKKHKNTKFAHSCGKWLKIAGNAIAISTLVMFAWLFVVVYAWVF